MSSMDTNESNNKSKNTINEVVEKTVEATNELGITDKQPNQKQNEKKFSNININSHNSNGMCNISKCCNNKHISK